LSSGRRRDICILLAGTEGLRGQALKTSLEDHYETRLDPGTFYSTLDALVDAGHLETQTEGLHDVYALTPAGAERLDEHLAWVSRETETD
jgi:DNA-binding PadR family transcriptional regulator